MVGSSTRVLHIITRLILGGAQENTLHTVMGQQGDPDFTVALAVGVDDGAEGSLIERAVEAGVDLAIVPSLVRPISPIRDLRALWKLYRLIKRGRYDIVHTHSSKAGILGRVAARLAGVPIVVHTLHSLVFHEYQSAWKNHAYIVLKRLCAPLTDVFISVNDKTTEGALQAGIGRSDQFITIYSGIELGRFVESGRGLSVEAAKQRLGIAADVPVVGKVARLFPLKGHEQFLEVAARIAKERADVHFVFVGDGPLRQQLEQRAKSLGIGPRTLFVGRVNPEDVPSHMQAMDVVAHTSLREGIARVLPQAGAVGKPVVTFALDGAPEVIRDGVSGYLIPPMDIHAFAERVISLLDDPQRRREFGEAGRRYALDNFRVEMMIEKINAVYKSLVSRKRESMRTQ